MSLAYITYRGTQFFKYSFSWILVIFIWGNMGVHAQSDRSQIKQLFDKTSDGLWISTYKGQFDQVFPIALTLGNSDKEYRGILIYNNKDQSPIEMTVEGHRENGKIILSEFDKDGQHTGNIILNKTKGSLVGTWKDIKETKEYAIYLQKTQTPLQVDSCLSPFLSKFYQSPQQDIELQLYNNSNNTEISIITKDTVINWLEDVNMDMTQEIVYNTNNTKYQIIPLANETKLIRITTAIDQKNHHVNITNKLQYNCQYFIDFNTKAEVHYPIIGQEEFDTWMKNTIGIIWKNIINTIQNRSTSDSPYHRNQNEIYIYTKVYNYSDRWLSGLIYVQSAGLEKIQTIPFTFNMEEKKIVKLAKIFHHNGGDSVYQLEVGKAHQKAIFLPPGLKRNWLRKATYKHKIIVDDNIVMFTDFNTIFGNNNIRIPLQSIKDKLKL